MISRAFGKAVPALAGLAMTLGGCSSPAIQSTAPSDLEVWFAFGLTRNQSGLQQAASTAPARDYLSSGQIGAQFGATPATEESATRVLGRAGFTLSQQATNAILTGTFSVAEAEKFFGVPLNVVEGNGVQLVQPQDALPIPAKLQADVSDVFGGYATLPSASASGSAAPTDECPTEGAGELQEAKTRYGIKDLQDQGLTGDGVDVALLEVDSFDAASVSFYASCTGQPMPQVAVDSANAAAGQLKSSTSESTLDVVSLGLMAPEVDVRIVQYDPNSSIVFPLAAVVAGQGTGSPVDMVSISSGFCSAQLSDQEVDMAEWLLMSLAASGVTSLASAGDTGSSGCAPGDQALAVMYPSESPNVLSIGGSQFDGSTSRVWKNEGAEFAGGGGASARFDLPDYQVKAGLTGTGRQTPDVVFLADPGQVGAIPVCDSDSCSWQDVAGTSATAPGVAGGLALILESLRAQQPDYKLGAVNPLLYASLSANKSAAQDITEGDNDLYQAGCCSAGPGFDMASGWGSLDFSKVSTRLGR